MPENKLLSFSYSVPSSSWVRRPEEEVIFRLLAAHEPVLLTAPRQSGLTTLLLSIGQQVQRANHVYCCYLTGRDLAGLSQRQCCHAVAARMSELLLRPLATPCNNILALRYFMFDLLTALPGPLVLLIDDVHLMPVEWRCQFLNFLRSSKNEGCLQPVWRKLRYLLGSHDLQGIYALNPASPLNFLCHLSLQPIPSQYLTPWLQQHPVGRRLSAAGALAAQGWTGNNPCLLVRLLQQLEQRTAPASALAVADVRAAAQTLARQLHWPTLSLDAQRLLQTLAQEGVLSSTSDVVEALENQGLVRRVAGKTYWANPLRAYSWRQGEAGWRSVPPELLLDDARMEVTYQGQQIVFYPQELKILFFLAQRSGSYFDANTIYRAISEEEMAADLGTVNIKSHIARLRRKLPAADYILTRRNIGYAFNPALPFRWVKT